MARIIRTLRHSFHSPQPRLPISNPNLSPTPTPTTRRRCHTRIANDYLLRLARNEIQFELDRFPLAQPNAEFNSFTVDHRPGEKWIALTRTFGDKERIRIEATLADASPVPASKLPDSSESLLRRIGMVISVNKRGSRDDNDGLILEVLCTAWPKHIEIEKLGHTTGVQSKKAYFSPYFKELDDELIEALYAFLEERGVDDDLAVFLHGFVRNKERVEYVTWMENLIHFIELDKNY